MSIKQVINWRTFDQSIYLNCSARTLFVRCWSLGTFCKYNVVKGRAERIGLVFYYLIDVFYCADILSSHLHHMFWCDYMDNFVVLTSSVVASFLSNSDSSLYCRVLKMLYYSCGWLLSVLRIMLTMFARYFPVAHGYNPFQQQTVIIASLCNTLCLASSCAFRSVMFACVFNFGFWFLSFDICFSCLDFLVTWFSWYCCLGHIVYELFWKQ